MSIERTRLWGFIFLFAGFAIGIPGVLMLVAHERYDATARIKVTRSAPDPVQNGSEGVYDPYFIQTEFEVLKSEVVLTEVVTNLHLDDTWAKRYNYGHPLEMSEVLGLLRQSLRLEPVKNTLLIDITFTSEDPAEAANVANGIASAYADLRVKQYQLLQNRGVIALKDQEVIQQQKIAELQTNVDHLTQEVDSPSLTAEAKAQKKQELDAATETLERSKKFAKILKLKVESLAVDALTPPSPGVLVIETAQTPTIPANANQRLGKDLLLAGVLVILAGVRFLWRAYFAAPTT